MEQIRCRACRSFRDGNRDERECTGCGRALRVKNGYCRLCWVQLSGGRAWEGTPPPAVAALAAAGVKTGHHQLFFDRMAPRTGAAPRRPRPALSPQVAWVQPQLPSPHARPGRRPPASPSLAAAVRVADRLAGARGWSGEIRRRIRQGLAVALDGHHEGQDVAWSRALPALRARHLCAGHVAEVLRQAGLLDDDRRPAFDAWLDRKLDGVAGGIRRDAGHWLRTLKDGGPRSRPRSIATVHSHLGKALPALLDWSARYHHLREVTRDDIQDHVRGLHGSQRHNTLVALRSLFGFCLSAGVIFRNPARGIKVGRRPSVTVLQPLGQDDIDDAVAAAATPAARLIVALAGVHAARSSTICAMLLSDADPGSSRLLLRGGTAPWTTSPRGCSAPGWRPAAPDGREPPTRTCSSTPRPPWAPGPTAGPGSTPPCAATPPPSRRCASTASSRKPCPQEPTPCTWQPPSAWTPAPPSATHPAPGNSSRPPPNSRTRHGSARTQGPEPLKKTEDPSVPCGDPSVFLNSGERRSSCRSRDCDITFDPAQELR
jgi:hypothetical protein